MPCAIVYVLENPELWNFWVDYSYKEIKEDLDKIDIIQSYIIRYFKEDIELSKELKNS